MKQSQSGFTVLELLVAIAIIGLLAAISVMQYERYQARARDSERLLDMHRLRIALELFFDDNGRYPGATDGISAAGEKIGDGGAFETAMQPYLADMPVDPLHDGSTYYYAYDPTHMNCSSDFGTVFGFRTAEAITNLKKDTACGSHQNLDKADYNILLFPEGS